MTFLNTFPSIRLVEARGLHIKLIRYFNKLYTEKLTKTVTNFVLNVVPWTQSLLIINNKLYKQLKVSWPLSLFI